jgi:hypothetical protein
MMGRPKGFAPWRPQKKTELLLAEMDEIFEEYREYLPMTVRQMFYRLVGKGHEKTERFYGRVQDACNRGRRSGRIPWSFIRDDGISRLGGETHYGYFENPREYYETYQELPNYYERSWHVDQPAYVAVLCEASGMVPMIERAVSQYRVEVISSSGFDSVTVKHDLFADALERYENYGQKTKLLHLGDHDPSGWWIHKSMKEDLCTFCQDHEDAPDDLVDLRRTALKPEQIVLYGIEPDLKPPSGDHAREFIARELGPPAQLEAIPPDTLSTLIRQDVERTLDLGVLMETTERERREKAEVQKKLDVVNEALRGAFGLDEDGA